MKNRNLIVMMAVGLCLTLILFPTVSYLWFDFSVQSLYLATVLGMVCGVIYGLVNYLRIRKMEHISGSIHSLLREEERVVLDGIARCTSINKTMVGRLYLTTDKIVFLPKQEKLDVKLMIQCNLDQVKQIAIKKTFGLFTNGLKICGLNKDWTFTVDFPEDWKHLINQQINIVNA
ncbi:hypothetical protein E9993_06700 [Labilibacter sediminis]|nr:hypothetical protein E9993_06700 [Labilibacter sediminis]